MRLVRLERQQSRVADDIRAALASLGRGSTVIGGIALVGVGGVTDRPIEAVVVLPHGVIIVIGVDLPDPALRLEAPLGGPWKADGWPLVADDDSVNPATEALDVSQACERQIAELVPGTAPVGTIIAVGPYVETVDQPAADLAGPVRVLHPTPTTMLAATVSLATAHRPRSVDQARALIRGLAPSAPELSDEVLLGEGFSRLTDDAPPESLWDDAPAGPGTRTDSAAGPGGSGSSGGSGASGGTGGSNASGSSGASGGSDGTGASSATGGSGTAGTTDWRTETPVEAKPEPTPAPEPAAAEPELPEPGEVGEAEPTEVLQSATKPEPHNTDSPARPVFPGAETTSTPTETEATEVLPAPAQQEPALSSRPVFPDTEEAAEPPQVPGSTPSGDPEPPESPADEAERTENLRLPAPDSDQTADLGHTAEAEQAPEHPAPQPTEAEQAAQGPIAPERTAEAGPELAGPWLNEAKQAGPKPTGPQPAEAAPQPTQAAAQPPLPSPQPQPPQPFPRPRPEPEPAATPRTVRWLPLGAVGGLVLLAVAAIAVATTGDGTAAAPPPPASTSSAAPPTTPVRSLEFALRAAGGDQRCASHAFGDAQASLQQTSCSGVKRASYAATVDGRAGAVTVGIVDFPDAGQAAAFKAVTDTPGGGGVLDLATETGQWGATPVPRFENAAYASKLDGSSVRIVQAVWAPGPSTPDDPGLVRAAAAALDLPAR
ncbi:hypothetical protein ACWEGE_28240 [Amycolatopsis sp. NPDC004747]